MDTIPQSFIIKFPCTNNIVEYEALLASLRLAIQWNIQHLSVFGSKLILKQVTADYLTKDEKLLPYKHTVDSFK